MSLRTIIFLVIFVLHQLLILPMLGLAMLLHAMGADRTSRKSGM